MVGPGAGPLPEPGAGTLVVGAGPVVVGVVGGTAGVAGAPVPLRQGPGAMVTVTVVAASPPRLDTKRWGEPGGEAITPPSTTAPVPAGVVAAGWYLDDGRSLDLGRRCVGELEAGGRGVEVDGHGRTGDGLGVRRDSTEAVGSRRPLGEASASWRAAGGVVVVLPLPVGPAQLEEVGVGGDQVEQVAVLGGAELAHEPGGSAGLVRGREELALPGPAQHGVEDLVGVQARTFVGSPVTGLRKPQ